MKKMFKIIVLFCLLFTIGCASGPKYMEVAQTIPELNPDKGRIYVYRSTILGAAIQPDVKLNGEVIGSSIARGFYFVDREPGDYKLMTSTEVDRSPSFILEADQIRYVRLNVSMGFFVGHVYPELVEEVIAQKELQECSYVKEVSF